MIREILEKFKIDEATDKAFIGKSDGMNFAVKINGFDNMSLKGGNFGTQVKLNGYLKKFKQGAKEVYIGSKGKATISSVKTWVKENNPTEFFAKWKPDSSFYKDDNVKILYK